MQNGTKSADIVRMETHAKKQPAHPAARREFQMHREITIQSMAYLFATECGAVQTESHEVKGTPPLVA